MVNFDQKQWDDNYKKEFVIGKETYSYYAIDVLEEEGFSVEKLPFTVKILLESLLRKQDGYRTTKGAVTSLAGWTTSQDLSGEIPFIPARVILQDFTGVPVVLDLAAMREAVARKNGHTERINPDIPVDLIIDHSVQVDSYGNTEALSKNNSLELFRNKERYSFLSWAQTAFRNLTVVPPGKGIVHQVNLEYLAQVVRKETSEEACLVYPDTVFGTDSHTTMINGLGVLGWGVGGIEAEAAMLGQPSYLLFPKVVGVRLTKELPVGATATDLALRITKLLRSHGVVDKFVEFFGEGVKTLSLADRATVANMAPEYGATCGFFPVDEETLRYLHLTGRSEEQIELVKTYLQKNKMFQNYEKEAAYSQVIDFDLSQVHSTLSGPKRPQDMIELKDMKENFMKSVTAPFGNAGHGLLETEFEKQAKIELEGRKDSYLKTGSVVIAAITSCTNTSNPSVMLGAGILAKKAVLRGLSVPSFVKTSLTPGSRVVTAYLDAAGFSKYLDELGFCVAGYGCATCIGNSGPLLPEIDTAINQQNLLVASVLSGNRNFEGRIHPQVKANYLASPPLVIAYALAGNVSIDLTQEPIGLDQNGEPVFLKELWPTKEEIDQAIAMYITPECFQSVYDEIYRNEEWQEEGKSQKPDLFDFDQNSTYIQNPPYFDGFTQNTVAIQPLLGQRVLGKFGDSVTTDHISPAGAIGKNTPAGKYLLEKNVPWEEFNTYGSRRGNHEVMMRGTFANIRIHNQLAKDTEGGYTTYWPTNEVMSVYDAAMKYQQDKAGLIVLAGKDYGMGSSRDWAAKGPALLGVKAVIAESYERIHRSNLVMMGILPLEFLEGESAGALNLVGDEIFDIALEDTIRPREKLQVTATDKAGNQKIFYAIARFDSAIDIDYYRHGGILQMVLREKL